MAFGCQTIVKWWSFPNLKRNLELMYTGNVNTAIERERYVDNNVEEHDSRPKKLITS